MTPKMNRRKRFRIAETILLAIAIPCALASFIYYAMLGDNLGMALAGLVLFINLYWLTFTIKDWVKLK